MDLNQLQVFSDVIRYGSFASVAKKIDLDPSSVSRMISSLEDELGFRLFQRTTRSLALTEAGKLYFDLTRNLISELETAKAKAADLVNEPMGRIRVAACTSFGERKLSSLLPKLTKSYPDLQVELVLDDQRVDIIEKKIDLAIRFAGRPEGNFIVTKLMDRPFYLCASPDYLKRAGELKEPSDLVGHDCLLFSTPGYGALWKYRNKDGEIDSIKVTGKTVISHGMTMTKCTLNGMGISMLPNWLCDEEIKSGQLVRIFPEYDFAPMEFDTACWLIYPSKVYLPLKLRVFIDFLKQELQVVNFKS